MRFKRKQREMPQLNTTSTADISFMLLIFFLVTTSMDTDKGITRQLPPPDRKPQEQTAVDKARLLTIEIDAQNGLHINSKPGQMEDVYRSVLQHVQRMGSRHLISLVCSPDASYDAYFRVQNQLASAYARWSDLTAQAKMKKPYTALSPEEKKKIDELCPRSVAEQYMMPSEQAKKTSSDIAPDKKATADE